MGSIITLVATTTVCLLLCKPIKNHAMLFYGLAACFAIAALVGPSLAHAVPPAWLRQLFMSIQHCTIAFSLLALVMFVGVFPQSSKVYARLGSIRGELAIIAFILCLGHISRYVGIYMARAFQGQIIGMMLMGFIVAAILTTLLFILSVTSLPFVKRSMNSRKWKAIQLLAYPFFGLIYLHVFLILGPSSLANGAQSIIDIVVYTLIFASYLCLRVHRGHDEKGRGLVHKANQLPR